MAIKYLIKIIIILLMIGLISYIWIGSIGLSCDKCQITFSNKQAGVYNSFDINYSMKELYNETKNKECPIIWNRVQGYVKS